jgi:hypothetical protein
MNPAPGRTEIYTEHGRIPKAIPLERWTGPEVFRKLMLPEFKTIGT